MRYDKNKKAEVVAFVKKHNEEKGRGGQSAANEKFGISAITIAKWLTAAGETLPGKGGARKTAKAAASAPAASASAKGKPGRPKGAAAAKPKKAKGKPGRPKAKAKVKAEAKPAVPSSAGTTSQSAKIQRLAAIDAQMQALQKEFDAVKNSL